MFGKKMNNLWQYLVIVMKFNLEIKQNPMKIVGINFQANTS